MIDGLRVDVTAAELSEQLSKMIQAQESHAAECGRRTQRLNDIERDTDDACRLLDELGWKGGFASLRKQLAQKRSRHLRRAAWLTFLRDHLAHGETYRLGERDLWLVQTVV